MTGKWQLLAAVPLALAIAACSSRTSNADTAAGMLPGDTSTTLAPTPAIPTPGIDTGMILDTTKAMTDTTRADSLAKDSTQKAAADTSKQHKTTKKTATRKPH